MFTPTEMAARHHNLDNLVREAARRGSDFGIGRDFSESGPLSGEWAGESIPELLGDLLEMAEALDLDAATDLCDAFESAAYDASLTLPEE